MSETTKVAKKAIRTSDDLPNQLVIKDGKLLLKDGSVPDFSEWDDMEVNLVPHRQLVRCMDDAWMLRHWGA